MAFNNMAKEEWLRAYQNRLIEKGGLTDEEAFDVMDASIDDLDFDENPEDAADEEMSYWGD